VFQLIPTGPGLNFGAKRITGVKSPDSRPAELRCEISEGV
jgi:hypothetical protein